MEITWHWVGLSMLKCQPQLAIPFKVRASQSQPRCWFLPGKKLRALQVRESFPQSGSIQTYRLFLRLQSVTVGIEIQKRRWPISSHPTVGKKKMREIQMCWSPPPFSPQISASQPSPEKQLTMEVRIGMGKAISPKMTFLLLYRQQENHLK